MAVTLVAVVAVLVLIAYGVTVQTLDRSLERTLVEEARAYGAAMEGAPSNAALVDATRAYLSARTGSDSGGLTPILVVRFNNGRTISNSEIRIEEAPGVPPTSTVTPGFVDTRVGDRSYRAYAAPVFSRDAHAGLFTAALDTDSTRSTASGIAATLLAAGLIALGIGLPLSYATMRGALSPLSKMARAAEDISHVHPGSRIAYDGPDDELGSLAASLNRMLSRLEDAMAEQRRFIADASHELRTPVAVVRGNVELLRSGRATSADADESLEMIESEAVRMGRLLDELLALARMENHTESRFQPLAVRTLLEESAARGRALGSQTFTIVGTEDVWVNGDPDMLEQALMNLVRNAVAHTQQDGAIELSYSIGSDRVLIVVADDGEGIPSADLERVFDRFHRSGASARDDVSGSGLGLAITKRIVELHNGTVGATARLPRGTQITITLPRTASPEDPSASTSS